MQRAVRIFERFLGTDHDDTAHARALLASNGNSPADAARAQPWRERSVLAPSIGGLPSGVTSSPHRRLLSMLDNVPYVNLDV